MGGFWSGRGALQHLLICGGPRRALGSLSGPSSPTTLMSWAQPSRPDVKSFTFSFLSFFFFSFMNWTHLDSSDCLVNEMRHYKKGKLGRPSHLSLQERGSHGF